MELHCRGEEAVNEEEGSFLRGLSSSHGDIKHSSCTAEVLQSAGVGAKALAQE